MAKRNFYDAIRKDDGTFKRLFFRDRTFCCTVNSIIETYLETHVITGFPVVNTCADLPDPVPIPGSIYVVLTSTGSKWIPTWLGGSFCPKGFYHSNGVTWEYLGEFPTQSTQIQVDAGVNTETFVNPFTFANAAKWLTKQDNIQLQDEGVNQGTPGQATILNVTGAAATLTVAGNVATLNVVTGAATSAEALIYTYIAGEVISGGKAVIMDTDGKVYGMDITNPYHYDKYIGISTQAAILNDPINVITQGVTNVLGTGWLAGTPYYISNTGLLSSTAPILGFCKQVGVGIDNDKINIINYSDFILI